jgi:regulator of protease activity HflC (stomatin/prohibitin superfamily)
MDSLLVFLAFLVPLAFVVLWIAGAAVKIVQEYERGVIFRLGRLVGPRGPGLFFIIPFVDRMVKVDLRVVTLDVPAQEVITRDNVTVRVNAVLYFRVFNPEKAVVAVTDFVRATHQIAQTTLRSVLGQSDLDELLSQREAINLRLQQIIDEQTEPWGIKVGIVEVKDVELPQSMQRAMARQAEAEREKRAKIIHASGEFEASKMLTDAARVIGSEPATIQLRYLQTLTEIASERNSTIIFPVPIELLSMIPHITGVARGSGSRPPPPMAEPTGTDSLATASTGTGSLPAASSEPIAGSAEDEAGPLEGLETRMKEVAAEHARFIEGDDTPSTGDEPLPGRK